MRRGIAATAAVSLAITLVSGTTSRADEHKCQCTADTYVQLSEGVPWTIEEAGQACEGLYPGSNRNIITDGDRIHNQGGDLRDALFRFDLTGISGAISNAILRLTCTLEKSTGSVATVTVHPMHVNWAELEADWKMRTSIEPWIGGSIESNGNYDVVPSATKVNPIEDDWTGKQVEFDVTPLVNRWINGGLTNFGLVLMSASDSGRGKRMDWCSRDGNPWRSNNWPHLIVHTMPFIETNAQSTDAPIVAPESPMIPGAPVVVPGN